MATRSIERDLFMHDADHPGSGLVDGAPLGEAVEVSNTTVAVDLFPSLIGTTLKVGEVLLIEGGTHALIGEVISIAANYEQEGVQTRLHVAMLATLDAKQGIVTPGVLVSPLLHGRAYRPHPIVIKAVLEDRRRIFSDDKTPVVLELAHPAHYPDVSLQFTPEKIFGRHCAILGTSGGGKSWTVARLLEQCANHQSKVILIDPTGEYESLDSGVFHVHLGFTADNTVNSREASLPYAELTEADLVAMFRPNGGSQLIKLRSAIKTLKLLRLEPRLASEGTMIKAHKSKISFDATYQVFKADLDRPENSFKISKLPLQIELDCVDPTRSATETDYWGGTNSHDHSSCVPLINRISDMLASPELACIFSAGTQPSIFKVIDRFLVDADTSILRISLQFLPSLHRTREIIANALGRALLAKGRQGSFKERPLLVVVDEAHQTLNSKLSDLSADFPLEAFNIIAKEGRKYGLTLCLATQRPRDIPDDVLSQVGTFIAHRLVNDADRSSIERATGSSNQNLLAYLPSLGPGEGFILGIDFATPLRVQMIPPNKPPQSRGPDYQRLWGQLRDPKS